ncbi:putative RNA helicase/RNAse III, partial [Aspergillus undulatus]|uniref:putative RNA helicase/RNAse III n=1 Tax=Aspergillus undulatus TaxID=1810928 RepID=UPI003CCDC608
MAFVPTGDPDPPDYRARSYQLEMFEASLQGNIVVAMGTGSGKTHIALLRIMHELEHSDGNKLIWFLAPTVALCLQQHAVIARHIPAAKSRTLTGLDKVELWTEQEIWDSVLDDIQIVVSTPAVLLDAMTHGFVRISRLGLIIFDEAHHCTRNHPANNVMRLFYHPAVAEHGPEAVPKILGLTASAAANLQELKVIEANLNAACTTPQEHRHELLEHTHRPELIRVLYTPLVVEGISSFGGMPRALIEAYGMLKLEDDPYVKKLRAVSPNGEALQKVLETGNTYCSDQLKKFVRRVIHIFTELGVWAADYFIWVSTEQLRSRVFGNGNELMDLDDDEKKYLVDILSKLPVPNLDTHSTDPADFPVSPKFEALVAFLLGTEEHDFSGLIFVQQRATVAVMSHLLTVHPLTRDRFRTGGFIGMSNSTKKKDMLGDLLTVNMQRDTLDDFRDGRKNLIVSTNVLEEGIDVSACSVVVCYDKPPNLKSFVQRRGRARRQHSTYAMVLSTEDDDSTLKKWHNVEKAMEEAYQEDRKRLEEVMALEDVDEDVFARFRVEATGAILTADNAMQHLFHFCSTLPAQANVDNKPEFSFERHDGALLKGKVTLPSCVIPAVRRATGTSWWKTERAARKEAAFQAYKALYEHGLVNDNLLPLTKSREFNRKDLASVPAIQDVRAQYDPWVDLADAWLEPNPDLHQSRIIIRQDGNETYMNMISPAAVPSLEPMVLLWDSETTYTVEFEAAEPVQLTAEDIESLRATTALYLQATTTRRLSNSRDFITLFGPDLPPDELRTWLEKNQSHEPAQEVFSSQRGNDRMGLVRNHLRYGEILLFKRWIDRGGGLELECDLYPKRRNLLQKHNLVTAAKRLAADEDHIETETLEPQSPKTRIIPAETATISNLPATESVFGRFIAVITDRLEAALVAANLARTILPGITFTDTLHIITALTMPLAQAPTNYQRYEFFGDSVLKFTVASQLYFANPNWHEGYLTQALHALVQNGRLARAALDSGLDRFIIARRFTPRRWSAPLISEKQATGDEIGPGTGSGSGNGKRAMSSKVLADVVEALIGAAYFDGGHEMARAVIQRFLPDIKLTRSSSPYININVDNDTNTDTDTPMSNSDSNFNTQTQSLTPHLINHTPLESALGYTFTDESILLEALTHPSVQHDSITQSYQRLEFLGDAVLDMLVVEIMRLHPRDLNQGDMTRVKQALVNGNLLGFLCAEFGFESNSGKENEGGDGDGKGTMMHLYTYLRHSPSTPLFTSTSTSNGTTTIITKDKSNILTRHSILRNPILTHITNGKTYPWSLLSSLNADKVLSDIIESILGAIYVDSGCDLDPCRRFIERLGLVAYAQRILDEGVDVLHPLQRVQVLLARLASASRSRSAFAPMRRVDADGDVHEVGEREETWKFEYKTVRVPGHGQPGSETETNSSPPSSLSSSTPPNLTTDLNPGILESEASYTSTITLSTLNLDLDDVTVHGYISKESAEVHAALKVLELLEERQLTTGSGVT